MTKMQSRDRREAVRTTTARAYTPGQWARLLAEALTRGRAAAPVQPR
jgi:hypothetical protein